MGGRNTPQGLMPGQRTTVEAIGQKRAQRFLDAGAVRIVSPDEPPPAPPAPPRRRDDPAPTPAQPQISPDAMLIVLPGRAFSHWNQFRDQVKLRAGDRFRAGDVGNLTAVSMAVENGTLGVVG